MGQEFFVKSDNLEAKVRQLLPSQGGKGAGFDLSASTQIVPIVDLTESAEGSNVREDIQKAITFDDVTAFNLSNVTSFSLLSNTGYWRLFGVATVINNASSDKSALLTLNNGSSDKVIYNLQPQQSSTRLIVDQNIDFLIKLKAGESLLTSVSDSAFLQLAIQQVADIDGNLN